MSIAPRSPLPVLPFIDEDAAKGRSILTLKPDDRTVGIDRATSSPDATIHYIDDGLTASMMYDMYDKDQLPDILDLTPDPTNGVPPE